MRIVAMLVLVLGGGCIAYGQQITGTIAGTVKDDQGALVTTANVKATNTNTGLSRSSVTAAEGNYTIPYLPVGTYSVEVTAPNFKKFIQQNIVLSVDQKQILNITLNVGGSSETITVSTLPPLVETSSAELGRTVEPSEIIGLPLVNRNVYAQISLTAGVQNNNSSNGTPNFTVGVPSEDVVVNGGIDEGTPMVSYYLDGGLNMTGIRNYGNQLPNPDALEEFRMETSNFSAQYGRMSGAVVTAVTKSGSNQFHGSLFEFNRNTDFNATSWGSANNLPLHRNQFGGVVGGPVIHDKAFFLFSYAGLRQVSGSLLSGGIVPTALERAGDFSQSAIKPNLPGTKTAIVGGVNSSPNCATGNALAGCIPAALLDKTTQNILALIPQANVTNNGVLNGYRGPYTAPLDNDEYLAKYDQNLSKDHVALSYFTINTTQLPAGSGPIPWSINKSFARQQNINISDVHTISSTTANQAWFTYTRVGAGRVNLPTTNIGQLGSNFTIQGPSSLPQLNVSGNFNAGGSLAGPVTDTDSYIVRDLISTVKGKHTLDFGFEGALEKDIMEANLYNFGVFTFTTSGPTTTGNAMSDFITGSVSSMEQDTPYHALINDWYYAFFLQDGYKISPRLTLNLGIRYDIPVPPTESLDRTGTFVPGVQSTVVTSAPLGLLYPGDKGVNRGIVDLRKHHISPRIGIAWDPFGDGKTAVRAGVGIFYGSVSGNEWNQPSNAQPFAIRQTFNSITSLTNVYGNAASFPNGDPFPYTYSKSSPRYITDASVETISEGYQWPYTYQINAAVERQLPGQLSVTTAYVASLTHNIPFTTDANYPAYAAGASGSQASIDARRPYNNNHTLGQVQYLESNQTASYHSLQISARKQLSHSFQMNGFFVWSKSFWSAAGLADGIGGETQDYANLWEERGLSDYDHKAMASISGVWNISYYSGTNFALKEVANGWQISPIITLNSGAPFNLLTGAENNFDSYSANRPNLVAGQNPVLGGHRSHAAEAAEWFNTAAFVYNGAGVAGGIGPGGADGNTPRDFLRAPGYRDVDLGLFREVTFVRGIKLQFRAEATNAFNLVSLGTPGLTGPPKTVGGTPAVASFGKITAAQGNARQIQLGLRLTF